MPSPPSDPSSLQDNALDEEEQPLVAVPGDTATTAVNPPAAPATPVTPAAPAPPPSVGAQPQGLQAPAIPAQPRTRFSTEALHSAIADPDAWQASLDLPDKAELATLLQGSPDPKARVRRILSIGYAADATGASPYDVSHQWDGFGRSQFSTDPRGLGLDAPVKNDADFFTALQAKVQKQKAQNDMLQNGPDSLLGMAHSAGISGKDYTQAFADWQDAHIDSDSYDTAKTGTYFDGGRQQYEASLAAGHNGEYNRLADRALALVDGAQEMTKDGTLVAPDMSYADRQRLTVDLALYPPEVRRNIIYPLIIAKAQAQGLDPKSAFRGIDSAMRSFDTLVQGSTQAAFRVGAGVLGGVAGMLGNEDGVRLAKAVNQQQLVYGELTQLANGTIDPIKKTGAGWLPDAVNTLGGLVPYVVTGGLGFGGAAGKLFPALSSPAVMNGLRVAGAAAMATGFASDISNQLKWDHPNMDQGAADTIGIVSGTAQALLSGLPGKWLSEGAPGVARLLARYASPEASAATRFAAGVLGQAVSHGVTFGVAIPATTPFVQELVSTVNSTVPGVKLGDEVQKMWQNLPSTIVPVLVLSLLGAGRATMEGPARAAKMGGGFINDPNALQMLGFNDAQAAAIRGAKDPVAALQAEFPNRANDASSMMAAGKAYADQVKAGQQKTQSLEESGALSVIAHPASDQWSITTKDGSKVTFPDWQSADAARWKYAADNHLLGAADAPAASTDTASAPAPLDIANPAQASKAASGSADPAAPTTNDQSSPAAPEPASPPTDNGNPNTANDPPSPPDLHQRAKAAGVQLTPQMEAGLRHGNPKITAAVEHLTSAQEELAAPQRAAPNAEAAGTATDKPASPDTDAATPTDVNSSDSVPGNTTPEAGLDTPAVNWALPQHYRDAEGHLIVPKAPPYDSAEPARHERLATAEASFQKHANDGAAFDKAYDALPDAQGGKVISADTARDLEPHYAKDREGALEYLPATMRVANTYAWDRLARELQHPRGDGKLVLLMGGWGAGKTYTLEQSGIKGDLIFDSALRDFGSARDIIETARQNGWKKVDVVYVQRPLDLVVEGALDRAYKEGRTVPLDQLPEVHRESQETARDVDDHYRGDAFVNTKFVMNEGTPDKPKPIQALTHNQIAPGGEYHYDQQYENGRRSRIQEIAERSRPTRAVDRPFWEAAVRGFPR